LGLFRKAPATDIFEIQPNDDEGNPVPRHRDDRTVRVAFQWTPNPPTLWQNGVISSIENYS
jgi:hypothetical protein